MLILSPGLNDQGRDTTKNTSNDFEISPTLQYITDEHLNYEPTDQDKFITNDKTGDFQRMIWG